MISNVLYKIQSALNKQDLQIATLPVLDDLQLLIDTHAQLKKMDFRGDKNLKNSIAQLLEIDENLYPQVKKITNNYLINKRVNQDREIEMHAAVFAYHDQLCLLYGQLIDVYQNQNKIKLREETFNLILLRYLNATFTKAKWCYFDDQPAPIGTWDGVHKVIKIAENLALMNNNLFLYDFQIKETSIAALLKRGFMMDTLQKANFNRAQIQLTEQVLKIWSTNPLIVNKYKQDRYQFFIALENDRGPERIRAIEKFGEQRYWKTTRLADLLEAYLCAADTKKSLEEFGLEKVAPPAVLVKLFKKLRAEWCVEGYARQRRKEARTKNNKLLNVSQGLYEIHHRLSALQVKRTAQAAANTAANGDFSFELSSAVHGSVYLNPKKSLNTLGSENWWLVDESNNGCAVDLGKAVSPWVSPGKLLGFSSPDDKGILSIAEIKSVRKQADGSYRAGLAIIAKNAIATQVARLEERVQTKTVQAYYVADSKTPSFTEQPFLALWLQGGNENNSSMIFPRGEYKPNSKYGLNLNGEDKLLIIGRVLDSHRDWLRVEASV